MKIHDLARWAAAAIGAALFLAPAIASAATSLQAEFSAMAADADGFVTAAEYKAPAEVLPDPRLDPGVKGPDGKSMFAPDGRTPLRVRLVAAGDTSPAAEGEVTLTPTQLRQFTFNRLDTDRDDRLSLAEYKVVRLRGVRFRFDQSDTNLDDRLTVEEYVAGQVDPPFTGQAPEAIKANIEQARKRSVERAAVRFHALDADGDGFVSRSEVTPS